MVMEILTSTEVVVDVKENINKTILSKEALEFLSVLHQKFKSKRLQLISDRIHRQAEIDKGVMPYFLPETIAVREGDWKIAPIPAELQDRRVEITGPVIGKW